MHSLHGDDLRKNARMQMPSSNDVGARQSARSTEHAKEVKSRQTNRAPGGERGGILFSPSLSTTGARTVFPRDKTGGRSLLDALARMRTLPVGYFFQFNIKPSYGVASLDEKKKRKTLTLDAAMRSVQQRRFHIWTFQTLPSPAPSYSADPFKFFRPAPGGLERKPRERKREMRNPCGWNRGRVSSLPCGLLRGNIF